MTPRFTRAENGVQGDDKLSHNGGDDDFAGFAVPPSFSAKSRMTGLCWMATSAVTEMANACIVMMDVP